MRFLRRRAIPASANAARGGGLRLSLSLRLRLKGGLGGGEDNGYVQERILLLEHKIRHDFHVVAKPKSRMRLGNDKLARLRGRFPRRKFHLDGIDPLRGRGARDRSGFIWPLPLPLPLPLLRGERVRHGQGRRGRQRRRAAARRRGPLEPPGERLEALEDLGGVRVMRYPVQNERTTASGGARRGGHGYSECGDGALDVSRCVVGVPQMCWVGWGCGWMTDPSTTSYIFQLAQAPRLWKDTKSKAEAD